MRDACNGDCGCEDGKRCTEEDLEQAREEYEAAKKAGTIRISTARLRRRILSALKRTEAKPCPKLSP